MQSYEQRGKETYHILHHSSTDTCKRNKTQLIAFCWPILHLDYNAKSIDSSFKSNYMRVNIEAWTKFQAMIQEIPRNDSKDLENVFFFYRNWV